METKQTSRVWNVMSVILTVALAGCLSSEPELTAPDDGAGSWVVDGDTYRFTGSVDLGDLDDVGRQTLTGYLADRHQVLAMTPAGRSLELDLADPVQARFATARLALAGKTPDTAPQLFELIAARQTDDRERAASAAAPRRMLDPDQPQPMHLISRASVTARDPHTIVAAATTTFPGGSDYVYVDTMVMDEDGQLLSDLGFVEEYTGGFFTEAMTTGDLARTKRHQVTVDSLQVEIAQGHATLSLVWLTQSRLLDPGFNIADEPRYKAEASDSDFNPPVVNDPKPKPEHAGSGQISICLNRTWTNDCDYSLNLNGEITQAVEVPLSGFQQFTSDGSQAGYQWDAQTIQNNANSDNPPGTISLILTDTGGGCAALGTLNNGKVTADLQAEAMKQFWSTVAVSGSTYTASQVSWGYFVANFGDNCRQVQDTVQLNMQIPMPYTDSDGTVYTKLLSIVSKSSSLDFTASLPKVIKMTNSCLAEGTMIAMADESATPIESITAGNRVHNPYARADHALTVMDTAVGHERSPMVRIIDDQGHNLFMTEKHPVYIVGRGMVQAQYVRKGDQVMTARGPSTLVEVSREEYGGKVYNLKVGSEREASSLGEDQTVVYANGIMVGDGQIQSKYEAIEMKATHPGGANAGRLAADWKSDYVRSAIRSWLTR